MSEIGNETGAPLSGIDERLAGPAATPPIGDGGDSAHGSCLQKNANAGFLALYLVICLVLYIGAFGVNVLGNSNNLYPSPLRPAQSDRAWKTRRLERLVREKKSPEILILGNSRLMSIIPAQVRAITGKGTFNYAVQGGMVYDSLAQFRYALRIGVRPKVLLVGADEWAFWGPISNYELQLFGHSGLFHEVPDPEHDRILIGLLDTATVTGTFDSALALATGRRVEDTATWRGDAIDFMDDGYMLRTERIRERAAGTYRIPPHWVNANWEQILTAHEFTPAENLSFQRRLGYFEALLALAQLIDCEVHVVMPALRPEFEEYCGGDSVRRIHSELGDRIREICRRHGAVFHDLTKLESYDGDPNEFWDGTHQMEANMRRMTNVIFGLSPDKMFPDLPTDLDIVNRLSAKK